MATQRHFIFFQHCYNTIQYNIEKGGSRRKNNLIIAIPRHQAMKNMSRVMLSMTRYSNVSYIIA